jgi:ABC-2 type transport system ATP-binding protein
MSYIETNDLTKVYGNQYAVKALNLHIKKGEVYGFIGKNGAGKTTTINMLLSLIHKSSGTVKVNDKLIDFTDVEYKRDIGYVPDVPVFPNHLNNQEYLRFVCEVYKIPSNEVPKKVLEMLKFVGLDPSDKLIAQYSRGMKQRLAIAQALIHDPSLIIMDEPTSALDPLGRKDVMDIIMKLKRSKTIFYSTHILDDVEKVCDRIGLIDQGSLLLEDDISSIQAKYFKDNVYIETTHSPQALLALLKKHGLAEQVEAFKNGVLCKTNGKNSGLNVLSFLIEQNIHIKKYEEVRASLEDIFMEVTK